MMEKTVDEIWEGLRPINSDLVQRVDDTHPLDLYLGRELTGEPILMLLTDEAPPDFPTGQSVQVRIKKMEDNRWGIIFKLLKDELASIFSQLCARLIESSRTCNDKSSGVTFIHSQYIQWRKLLERGISYILDESSLRGLLGELLTLERLILTYGGRQTIESWTGPSRADQDFRFNDRWYEVKTIRPGATCITISSAEQLDLPLEYKGELIVVVLDRASRSEPGSFIPVQLVERIKELLENDARAIQLFETTLEEFGFFLLDEYLHYHYVLRDLRSYEVTLCFPALTRSHLHPGIKNVKYEIFLSSLAEFEI